MGLEALGYIGEVATPDLSTADKLMLPSSGDNGEEWLRITNLRLRIRNDHVYWVRRGGSEYVTHFAATILSVEAFTTRVSGESKDYIAVHLNNGALELYDVQADDQSTILEPGTLSTTEKVWLINIGEYLYAFDADGTGYYYDLGSGVVSLWGVRIPRGIASKEVFFVGKTSLGTDESLFIEDEFKLTSRYRSYVLVDVLNDGSISCPSGPFVVVSLIPNPDDPPGGAQRIHRLRLEAPQAEENVFKRLLFCTRWESGETDAIISDGFDDEEDALKNEPRALFNASDQDHPNGRYFFVKEISRDHQWIDESTSDSDLLRGMAGEGVPLVAGVHTLILRGQGRPYSVAGLQGTLTIAGYLSNRTVPEFYRDEAQDNPAGKNVRISAGEGLTYTGYLLGVQFVFGGQKAGRLAVYNEFFSELPFLKEKNFLRIHSINATVSRAKLIAVQLPFYSLRFGNFPVSNGSSIEFVPDTGYISTTGDYEGNQVHTITILIDSTPHTIEVFTGFYDTIPTLIGEILFSTLPLGITCGIDSLGNFRFNAIGEDILGAEIAIDVQNNTSDLFNNLIVDELIFYPGTTTQTGAAAAYELKNFDIGRPETNGHLIRLEIPSIDTITSAPVYDFQNDDISDKVSLHNYVATCIPPQFFTIDRQGRIADESQIMRVLPVDIEGDANLRLRIAVLTDENIQYGLITEGVGGFGVTFDTQFEIVDPGTRCKSRTGIARIGRAFFFQSNKGISVLEGKSVQHIIPKEMYAEMNQPLRTVAYNEDQGEVWFNFGAGTDFIVYDIADRSTKRMKYGWGINNAFYFKESLFLTTSTSIIKTDQGNQLHDVRYEPADPEVPFPAVAIHCFAISPHLGRPTERLTFYELTVAGEGVSCTPKIDLQSARNEPSGYEDGTTSGFSSAFNDDTALPAKSVRVYGTPWQVNRSGVMPRIRLDMVFTAISGFIQGVLVKHRITANKGITRQE